MQLREVVLGQIHHHDTPSVPYSLSFEGDVAERVDAYYGNQEWRSRLMPYIVGVGAVDTDIREVIDDVYYRDGFGGLWRMDRRPWHLEKPALSEPSLEGYEFPSAERFLRPDWKESAFKTCEEHKESFLIGNLGWGLFERSWCLRGYENTLMDVIAEPEFFEEVLDRLTDLYLEFVEYTVDLPIDAVLFGDDWGDQRGVTIGAARWRRFLKPRWAKIYAAVHRAGKLVMHHSCGSVAEIMPDIIEIGMDVLESVQPEAAGMNPYELKSKWGDKITFWGCLGSQSILPFGTPDQIKTEVGRLCTEMGRGGGYLLAPAKGLQPETPTENAVAVVEAFLAEDARALSER